MARLPSLQPGRISRDGRWLCRALQDSRARRGPAPRSAGMVDDARLAVRSRCVAIRSGSRRAPRHRAKKLGAPEELRRIDRGRTFADLEVQLWRRYVAGLSGVRDHLPAFDRVPAFDEQLARMRVCGHKSVRMADQDKVSIAF